MRHFKIPLIVSAVVLVLMIGLGLGGVFWINRSGINTNQRSEMLGQGMGILTMIIVFPFWIYGAARFGKERREGQAKRSSKSASSRRKKLHE
ncbi:MAG: hypothetical protein EXS05_23955 [Planctomycetaceae bacterium]|nr:hypothetical protein [Planctomycetaceae bacterium]